MTNAETTVPRTETLHTTTPEELARKFHDTYERLAPQFGYSTRKESAKPWEEVPGQNRELMVAVCSEILGWLPPSYADPSDPDEQEQFQKFWTKVVAEHQNKPLSIGDAYRLKDLLYRDRFGLPGRCEVISASQILGHQLGMGDESCE